MSGDAGVWWVFDPGDCFAHVLADLGSAAEPGVLVTMCGRELPAERTTMFSVPPSLAVCPRCGAVGARETSCCGVPDSDALLKSPAGRRCPDTPVTGRTRSDRSP